ncbi:SGNH/GDSL hydrolase family protein [[Mycoplasma] cavipharyngis]|uniref:SGNH/GDSL hydrolase family protein n=1 Tax=[Mycoplasma] cavipharyngis TaxID=92757 RepID=UPI0037043689
MKKQIKYVAIGDSVAAGYNADLGGIEASGSFNKSNQKVSGWSYPAFLANYILNTPSLALEEFDNLAISGSQINDWLYFLNHKPSDYEENARLSYFKSVLNQNKISENPYKDRITNYFGTFDSSNFSKLITKIKGANLISISLGANDWFSLTNDLLNSILDPSLNSPLGYLSISTSFLTEFTNRISSIRDKYESLISVIKKINSNAEIVITDYPMPLLRIHQVINQKVLEKFNQSLGEFGKTISSESFSHLNNISQSILDDLNLKAIKNVANKTQVNFIHVDDSISWNQNRQKFAHNPFDIHPTEYGQKRIAEDIFLKLSLNQTTDSQNRIDQWIELNHNWNQKYLLEDNNQFRKIFDVDLSNEDLIRTILTDSNSVSKKIEEEQISNDRDLNTIWKSANKSHSFIEFAQKGGINLYQLLLQEWLGLKDQTKFNNFLQENDNYSHFLTWLNNNPGFLTDLYNNLEDNLDLIDEENRINQKYQTATNVTNKLIFFNVDNISPITLTNLANALHNLSIQTTWSKDQVTRFIDFFKKDQELNQYLSELIVENPGYFFRKLIDALKQINEINNFNIPELAQLNFNQINTSNVFLNDVKTFIAQVVEAIFVHDFNWNGNQTADGFLKNFVQKTFESLKTNISSNNY